MASSLLMMMLICGLTEMDDPNFYLLALYAMKLNPDDLIYTSEPDGSIKYEVKPGVDIYAGGFPPVSLWALGVVAESEEQAKRVGMEKLMEVCPWRDGWINHYVSANTVSRASLLRVVEEATGEDDRDDDEWPDVIM